MRHRLSLCSALLALTVVACHPRRQPLPPAGGAAARPAASGTPQAPTGPATVEEATAFFAKVDADLHRLYTHRDRAAWVSMTYITDDTETLAATGDEAVMEYLGHAIQDAKRFDGLPLPPDVARQAYLLKLAATTPAPADPALRSELSHILASMAGDYGKAKSCSKDPRTGQEKCLELGDLSKIIKEERDYNKLLDAWKGWHDTGKGVRDRFARYVQLGNKGAEELGYKDLGEYWRSGYDMPPQAFSDDIERLWQQVRPLYEQLHCYVRSRLTKKYGADKVNANGSIPAHLLGNMWAQEWADIYPLVEPYPGQPSLDVTRKLVQKKVDAKGMVKLGEQFFTSLGMDPLPQSFWDRSMFTKPKDRNVVCHASAWDVQYANDLRIKMCIKPDEEDLITIHHELGHDYYFHYYYQLPVLFQNGANDGFHEGIGDTLTLSITPTYLKSIGLLDRVPDNAKADINLQLKQALEKVAFLPFGKVIDEWRWDVFSGKIPKEKYNEAWWAMRKRVSGIEAPLPRDAAEFDPGAKYHVPANTPYMRYFLARIYQFQFHRALCQAAGQTGPLSTCSIYGNKAAGEKFMAMLKLGASKPWPEALAALSGETQADASALLDYFAPLSKWLAEQNKGQTCGWAGGEPPATPAPAAAPAALPAASSLPGATATPPVTPTPPTTTGAATPATSAPSPALSTCPPGTEPMGQPPPKGREVFCARKGADGAVIKQGPYKSFTLGGRPELEGEYADGQMAGHWIIYHPNGSKESEGAMTGGKKTGVWTFYDPNGKKLRDETMK
jgi:peptidyl-dipeptidase A